jgi:hypothetical protein
MAQVAGSQTCYDGSRRVAVRSGAMDSDVARTQDWIGSVLLFAVAILIILAFGFL